FKLINMYTGLLHTHNMFRWLVLILLVVVVVYAIKGWAGKKKWTKRDKITGLVLTIFMDVQFLVGLILYAFVSPFTKAAFADFGAAMKNAGLRFYAIEHILIMLIALVFVHIGKSKSKKLHVPWKKHRAAAIWYGLALVLVLVGIPWDRALFF
ncbi:MAG: hypothetical protein K0B11_21645, partial [Mariniphaga sp.]|nr:hypothetical protein [Mariniphaga sp.]